MAYGVNRRRLARIGSTGNIEHGQASDAVRPSWEVLSETGRLAAIERALSRDTDVGGMSPIAL